MNNASKKPMKIVDNRYVLDPTCHVRAGGMSEVCKAYDMKEQKNVAVKFFNNGFADDRYTLEAFNRESKSLQALDHPNIVRIVDGGRDPETQRNYLVLEWLELGLLEFLKQKPLNGWDDFFEVVGRPVLSGLSHAFSRQIIHRDVKPQNILLTADHVIKVTDFGIAKYKNAIQPGLTLAGFRSEPYAPPERDGGLHSDTRDVYGFAVVVLQCLTDAQVITYDDVYRALEELDAPPGVMQVLRSSLDRDPANRPENIAVLADRLEKIQTEREQSWVIRRRCFLRPEPGSLSAIRRDYPHLDYGGLTRVAEEDLAESCAIRIGDSQKPPAAASNRRTETPTFQFIGAQYLYHVHVDRVAKDHLVIARSGKPGSGLLDTLRADSWMPPLQVKTGRPPSVEDGKPFIQWLASGLSDHEERQAAKRQSERQERIFRIWEQLLNASDAVERSRQRSMRYSEVSLEGTRFRFTVPATPDEDVVGEPWYVPMQNGVAIAGEIESVSDHSVVLWAEGTWGEVLPQQGELRFDTRASRKALQKQRAALDAIRFERCVRPALKSILAEPSSAALPQSIDVRDFFQTDIDEEKRTIVRDALGTRDFLFIEGPPGTGKTRLIAEIILQTLHRVPNSRILLTSQTHVALDNALERVLSAAPDLKLVRIGRRQDLRVAESVRGLLLDNQADEWLKQVRKNSLAFLDRWADEHNVEREDVTLGIAVSRLRLALVEQDRLQQAVESCEASLAVLKAELASRDAQGDGTTYHELTERIQQAEEQLTSTRHSYSRAQASVRQAKKSLAEAHELGRDLSRETVDQLEAWENDLLNKDETTRACKQLIELVEEWELRFGRSSDFYGALLADAQVVAGTCVGFMGPKGIQNIAFDLCIVDEASKAMVTEILVPLSRARTWIVVGDRRQLPPFIDDALESADLLREYGITEIELKRTLLDELGEYLPRGCYSMLTRQYRMRRAIGDLVSHCFYDGQLKSARDPAENELSLAIPKPVTWFSTAKLEKRHEVAALPSYKNMTEVREAIKILQRIDWVAKIQGRSYFVVFLTGYGAQRLEFERALASVKSDLRHVNVMVHTVDAFQGREADIGIYSVTRNNDKGIIGFLSERRRLNVALSRAKDALVIVGDHVFCRSIGGDNPFHDILGHIDGHPSDCSLSLIDP